MGGGRGAMSGQPRINGSVDFTCAHSAGDAHPHPLSGGEIAPPLQINNNHSLQVHPREVRSDTNLFRRVLFVIE